MHITQLARTGALFTGAAALTGVGTALALREPRATGSFERAELGDLLGTAALGAVSGAALMALLVGSSARSRVSFDVMTLAGAGVGAGTFGAAALTALRRD